MENEPRPISAPVELPPWYVSTQGPQISGTIKVIALLLVPALKTTFGLELPGPEVLDHLIDGLLIAGFGIWAIINYRRARKNLGSQIEGCHRELGRMRGMTASEERRIEAMRKDQ